MRVTAVHVVHRNEHPSYAPESYSGTALARFRTPSGGSELRCAFRLVSARMSPDGRIVLFGSADEGRSWQRLPSPLEREPDWPAAVSPTGTASLAGSMLGSSQGGTAILGAARM